MGNAPKIESPGNIISHDGHRHHISQSRKSSRVTTSDRLRHCSFINDPNDILYLVTLRINHSDLFGLLFFLQVPSGPSLTFSANSAQSSRSFVSILIDLTNFSASVTSIWTCAFFLADIFSACQWNRCSSFK